MAENNTDTNSSGRETIALWVIACSGIGIVVVSIVALCVGILSDQGKSQFVMGIFNTLIPLFGTWVATVIAFYFSRENFATAAKATRELVGQLGGDDRLRQIAVRDVWIPVAAVEAVPIPAGKTEADILFADVRAKLSTKVSRVPIWDSNKVVRYIIHESMIYKFIAEQGAVKANPTLQDFLTYNNMQSIVTKIAYVPQDGTLADAKAKMESVADCQDVLATAAGQKTEPMLGWITNTVIAAKAKA